MRSTTPASAPQHRPSQQRHRRIGRGWLAVAAAALGTAGVAIAVQPSDGAAATSASGYRQDDLRLDTEGIQALGITGVQARVTTASGRDLVATTGVAVAGTNRPVPRDGYFRIASTGKALMATVILQLVDEGKLSLDDRVDRWLPGVIDGNGNDGRKVTVRQLLQNTSGLHDDLPGFDTPQEYYQHRYDTYTPEQIVAQAMKHHPDFQPGTGWSYSNTGYVVLGMIVEKAAGRPWQEEVESRILKPLGMNHTYLPGTTSPLRRPHADGYQVFTSGERTDVTEQIVPDLGGYVSTTADVNRFFQGLLGGKLLSEAHMAEMQDTVPVDKRIEAFWPGGRYGLGLVNRPLTCGGSYWSHEGGEAGYITLNGATDDGSRTVTVSMSTSFNDLDETLRQHKAASDLVDRALCDTSSNR
ncbi:beta-lactamase family protein [Streptomyces sp. NBC_00841]|uniref:serine hydrolase domain-containing protein n=1 Tax=unclassified Streptomyces TaxID=2593676 RepID=UPI00225144A9|nr:MULTISPECIES: serine hydrolase domain-containing protein [unclassified Streptomyces]MCX4537077.1 beta-lactamase family protein [Streptomyces sp. NBC_01669]WRZ97679.1 beta-lactamase family protein [Streptomyces sp. NBC_00841]